MDGARFGRCETRQLCAPAGSVTSAVRDGWAARVGAGQWSAGVRSPLRPMPPAIFAVWPLRESRMRVAHAARRPIVANFSDHKPLQAPTVRRGAARTPHPSTLATAANV
jgi:hypothetical protein